MSDRDVINDLNDESDEEFTEEEIAEQMSEAVSVTQRDKKHSIFWKLYHGETNYRFVERRKLWYSISAAIILAGFITLFFRGLNFGLEFEGGRSWRIPTEKASEQTIRDAYKKVAKGEPKITFATVKSASTGKEERFVIVQSKSDSGDAKKITDALVKAAGADPKKAIDFRVVSSSWGKQITSKALTALIVFFVLVSIYISWRFEPKMAFATFVALVHDLLITIGVYAILGFEVTPATVIAVLTIQGYSIYDGIVVFDKVNENTRGLAANGKMTYSDMIDLSLNQVLMRSINTSLTALLPILSMLIVGSAVLGVTALQEFALALFIGLLAGAYSSIFIASPVLAGMKEKEPRYANLRARLAGKQVLITPAAAAAASSVGGSKNVSSGKPSAGVKKSSGPAKPRPRKKGKRR